MIDRLVNLLFWWTPLRQAIFAEVHFYDHIDAAMNEPTNNLTWEDGGLWYGYTYDSNAGRYYFDDTGHKSMTDLWDNLWEKAGLKDE
jgi:hypothetical protein